MSIGADIPFPPTHWKELDPPPAIGASPAGGSSDRLEDKLSEALEIVQAKLSVAQSVMLASGHWRNTEGYLTDAALWIERAGSCASETLSLVSQGEGGRAPTHPASPNEKPAHE